MSQADPFGIVVGKFKLEHAVNFRCVLIEIIIT
jgi:hypothetical protein